MTWEFVLTSIIIPGLLAGIFAPMLVKACNKLWMKLSGGGKR